MAPLPPGYVPWYRRPALLVFVAGLLGRLLVLARFAGTPYFLQQKGDMLFYHLWAERILAGQWTDHQAFYGLPGYAFLLAGIYRVVGENALVRSSAVGVLQVILEAITATIIFKLAIKVCGIERKSSAQVPVPQSVLVAGFAASLAWITFWPAQTFAAILMPTAWVVCAYWVAIWRLAQPGEPRWWHPWGLFGLAIGVLSMLVATITFLLPLVAVRMYRSVAAARPWRERLPRLAGAAALVVAGLFAGSSPAWVHNYYVAHDRVLLSAHGGLNFWMGNNPDANGYPKVPPGLRTTQDGLLRDSLTWPERELGRPLKRSEVSQFWSAKAHDYITHHRGAWLRLLAVKFRNFWNGFQYDDLSVITLLRERGVLLPGLRWGVVAALGLAGLPFAVQGSAAARWVAAAVLLHLLAIMPVFITERYRLAAAPGLLLLGTYGLWHFFRLLGQRRWAPASLYALLLAGAMVFTSWPAADPSLAALDPFNVGVKELSVARELPELPGTPEEQAAYREEAARELERAQKHLELAWVSVKSDPGLATALGDLFRAKANPEQAAIYYLLALRMNAGFTAAHLGLGHLALGAANFEAAAQEFIAATQLEPENANAHFYLAQARAGLGQPVEARAALAMALRLAPTRPAFQKLARELEARP